MISKYYRPLTLAEALILLSAPNSCPLGGGTILTHRDNGTFAVVDLQALGLNKLHKTGNHFDIGATVTLQDLLESPYTPPALKTAIKLETPLNLRTLGTVAGLLVVGNGHSPLTTVMLALDAKIEMCGLNTNSFRTPLGDFLPMRLDLLVGKLITSIEIPLQAKLAFMTVGRSLSDKPIICVALAQWPSGRTRLVIGGWGDIPVLAMDGTGAAGIEAAARNATHDATDEWASAEYRSDVAAVLSKRCLESLE
jgi:CO/xanthine dehydrogenase FAD-binding subunit